MPGFDRTGPQSEGPLTGRGRGKCKAPQKADVETAPLNESVENEVYGVGRGGKPYGGGQGHCHGGGRRRKGSGRWTEFNKE